MTDNVIWSADRARFRMIHRYARRNGIAFDWRPDRGKGSHGLLVLGAQRTVVRNPKDELKTGTYRAMLKHLGLTDKDLR